jgi:hypothetical protein
MDTGDGEHNEDEVSGGDEPLTGADDIIGDIPTVMDDMRAVTRASAALTRGTPRARPPPAQPREPGEGRGGRSAIEQDQALTNSLDQILPEGAPNPRRAAAGHPEPQEREQGHVRDEDVPPGDEPPPETLESAKRDLMERLYAEHVEAEAKKKAT